MLQLDQLFAFRHRFRYQGGFTHHVNHHHATANLNLLATEADLGKHPDNEFEAFLQHAFENTIGPGIRRGPLPDRQIAARQLVAHDCFHCLYAVLETAQ